MLYFYLDSRRRPQGPHSREELLSLLQEGQLSPESEIAFKGAERWLPLRELLELPVQTESAVPQDDRTCPICGKPLAAEEDGSTPLHCPSCKAQLRPASAGFIDCSLYTLQQYAIFRGRATRAEFWWFFLFAFAVSNAPSLAVLLLPTDGSMVVMANVFLDLSGLISLILILPLVSVSARRLHDSGHSAKLLLYSCILHLLSLFLFIPCALVLIPGKTVTGGVILILYAFLFLASVLLALYILCCLLEKSQPKANRHGSPIIFPPHAPRP